MYACKYVYMYHINTVTTLYACCKYLCTQTYQDTIATKAKGPSIQTLAGGRVTA